MPVKKQGFYRSGWGQVGTKIELTDTFEACSSIEDGFIKKKTTNVIPPT
jgi:hypothetical protein